MKPTLLILAAGMGSRYGGLKQLDPVGPDGATILDYSVFDALRAGFGKVVFVIRRDFEQEFRTNIGEDFRDRVEVDYVFQSLDQLPAGFAAPEGRQKPWGTAHAIWCAREAVREPFAAINADDFYGADAYRQMAGFLTEVSVEEKPAQFAMVGFRLGNTLSEHGTVARGVCRVAGNGLLDTIDERTAIARADNGGEETGADGAVIRYSGEEPVSMNFWGFTPAVFPLLEERLKEFLGRAINEEKSECYIPVEVGEMIKSGRATVRVLPSNSVWFGVTYREDKPRVVASIQELIAKGDYPAKLWA